MCCIQRDCNWSPYFPLWPSLAALSSILITATTSDLFGIIFEVEALQLDKLVEAKPAEGLSLA